MTREPRPTVDTERLMSAVDLAAKLGCTVRHVYRLSQEHRLPSLMVGKELRFVPADVEDYIAGAKTTVVPLKPRASRTEVTTPAPVRRGVRHRSPSGARTASTGWVAPW